MGTWENKLTGTLKVRKVNSGTDTFTFTGINADTANTGTPEQYLGAVNNLLNIAGTSATITGMTFSLIQEVAE